MCMRALSQRSVKKYAAPFSLGSMEAWILQLWTLLLFDCSDLCRMPDCLRSETCLHMLHKA